MDLQDIRDGVVIGAVSALALTLFVVMLICAFISYKVWRLTRRANRLAEEQLRSRLTDFNVRVAELAEEGLFSGSGLLGLGVAGYRRVQERRKPKRRRFRILGFRIPGLR